MEDEQPNFRRIRMWYDALRNGSFEQGRGQLVTESTGTADKFCCLGIAAEVARSARDGVVAWTVPSGEKSWHDMGTLPIEVRDWYGLKFTDPVLDTGGLLPHPSRQASILNDDERWSFEQIADAIARTWPQILEEQYAS